MPNPPPASGGSGGRVDLVGLDAANRALRDWSRDLGPAVEQELAGFASTLARTVASTVPVLTGTLKGSVEVAELGPSEDGVGVAMGAGIPYAGWIEYGGTRGRPATPQGRYLGTTAVAAETRFLDAVATAADKTVRGYPWPKAT
jgi:hypothetical protein